VTAIGLQVVALGAVVLSFVFSALVVFSQRVPERRSAAPEAPDDTISRVIADIERLAALRDRGALTEREFTAQKAKILRTRK
jgi:hypothetical protein